MDDWRDDIYEEISSINGILPEIPAADEYEEFGRKTQAIQDWITRVLLKIIDYQVWHYVLLDEAAKLK